MDLFTIVMRPRILFIRHGIF